jgi:hypothetical protein
VQSGGFKTMKVGLFLSLKNFSRALRTLPKFLYDYYTAPQHETYKRLRNGFIYFSVGLITIYIASTAIEPSLKQELFVLAGMLLGGLGFFIAILAYIRIVISRILSFFKK